ncbi:MAG TPA: FecR domain-containing protein [Prolixibacteraceae bacterium]
MKSNHIIPPEKENRWVAFLNGEPDIIDVSNKEVEEMDDLTSVWEAAGTSFSNSAANPDQAWLNLQKELNKSDRKLKIRTLKSPLLKYAAMIVMAIGIGFVTYKIVNTNDKQVDRPVLMATASTVAHPVNFTVITLPDGSTVKMNANTRIEYPERFAADVRKVKLSGEAFFEVTRDTAHPFIIETDKASVEVLGTSFNVSAYPGAELVEVNVRTGKVKLTQNATGSSAHKSAILPAGERGWINVTDGTIGQDVIISSNYSAWITKEIIFQRTPLAEAFAVLENTYHVKIRMDSPDIGEMPSNANFENQKLDFIIDVIARTHKLKVKRNGDEIVFARAVK